MPNNNTNLTQPTCTRYNSLICVCCVCLCKYPNYCVIIRVEYKPPREENNYNIYYNFYTAWVLNLKIWKNKLECSRHIKGKLNPSKTGTMPIWHLEKCIIVANFRNNFLRVEKAEKLFTHSEYIPKIFIIYIVLILGW